MQLRSYLVPTATGLKSVHVDLDHREPLSDEAVDALLDVQSRLIKQKNAVQAELHLITQRIVLSGEAKLAAARKETTKEA